MRSVAPILNHLNALGFPEDRALACLGIERTALRALDTRVDYQSVERLWQAAIDTTGDPALPLRAARLVEAAEIGLLAYIAAASRDGRSAFETARELVPLMTTLADISLDAGEECSIVRYCWNPSLEISLPTREYAVGTIVQATRSVGSRSWCPEAALFAYPPPAHADEYERILELPVHFEASHDAVVFAASMPDELNPASDPALVQALERHAQELLAKLPLGDDLQSCVRHRIALLLPSGASAEAVAEALGMSTRNLRRRLEADHTSYKHILDEVRCELARQYLAQERRGVEEVAIAIGFSDGSALHKAFRRWTGESPAEFARTLPGSDERS
ncbi:MAG: AraC family transcriptional regulator [Deltaproteobacteria bacterium]|nr:AraC family transcriptional regulator [Deltaproteobacteria bacterium]